MGASLGILHHELEFWWELTLLMVIMLLGHWIEMRSLAQTTSALDSLAALLPDAAECVEGDHVVVIAHADLRVGDIFSITVGVRTDLAIASAGVILASDDPRSVLSVIELSRANFGKMQQHPWWAAGYNLLSVPLAAGILARSDSCCRWRSALCWCRCRQSWSP